MMFPAFQMKIICNSDVLKRDSHCGESRGHLPSPHRVWTPKCEGGERLAQAQLGNWKLSANPLQYG